MIWKSKQFQLNMNWSYKVFKKKKEIQMSDFMKK